MRRRSFLAGVGAAILSAPVVAHGQASKVWRIAWLSPADGPGPNHQAFLRRMKELGYEQGKNLVMEWAWVGSRTDQMPAAAARLVQWNPDAIVTQSQICALAAKKATQTIPTVFVGVRDPVVAGIVESMARPGGNLTGVTLTPNAELAAKHLELLREITPKTARLAVFWNPDVPIQASVVETIRTLAESRAIVVRAFGVHKPGDIERAFETMIKERFDGLLTLVEWFTFGNRALIAKLATEARIPTLFEVKDYVTAGGLLAYGVVYHEHFASAAHYLDRIFKGAKPADLPVQQPARLEMVVNLKAAKAMRISIPPSVVLRADEVIEH